MNTRIYTVTYYVAGPSHIALRWFNEIFLFFFLDIIVLAGPAHIAFTMMQFLQSRNWLFE